MIGALFLYLHILFGQELILCIKKAFMIKASLLIQLFRRGQYENMKKGHPQPLVCSTKLFNPWNHGNQTTLAQTIRALEPSFGSLRSGLRLTWFKRKVLRTQGISLEIDMRLGGLKSTGQRLSIQDGWLQDLLSAFVRFHSCVPQFGLSRFEVQRRQDR